MNTLFAAIRPRVATGLLSVLLLTIIGCKPTSSTGTTEAKPPTNAEAPRQPTAADFQAFFQSLLPATAKVSDVKMDAPARMTNVPPGSSVWILSTKTTITPAEDLFSLPSPQDTQPIDNLVAELNALVAWRNAYANSNS